MKFKLIIIAVITLIASCKGQEKDTNNSIHKNPDAVLEIISEALGDLDKDGIPEKVVIYNTDSVVDFGLVRALHIYKKEADNWKIWRKSNTAIMKSNEGGASAEDPFQNISIKNGILIISHQGGGGPSMWSFINKYRFQNNAFYLIGVSTEDSHYEDKTVFDYNLSTGKAIYVFYTDGVLDTKEEFNHKTKKQPKLSNMTFGKNKITTPKSKATIYF
ncbi:MAG: hypothetical protein QM499_12110 [Flavobacteriaceae bacterium]